MAVPRSLRDKQEPAWMQQPPAEESDEEQDLYCTDCEGTKAQGLLHSGSHLRGTLGFFCVTAPLEEETGPEITQTGPDYPTSIPE